MAIGCRLRAQYDAAVPYDTNAPRSISNVSSEVAAWIDEAYLAEPRGRRHAVVVQRRREQGDLLGGRLEHDDAGALLLVA